MSLSIGRSEQGGLPRPISVCRLASTDHSGMFREKSLPTHCANTDWSLKCRLYISQFNIVKIKAHLLQMVQEMQLLPQQAISRI